MLNRISRFLLASLGAATLALPLAASADSVYCHQSGDMTFCSDGTYSRKAGDMIYHSDGSYSRKAGDMIYHSDGSYSRQAGDMTYHSDGTYSRRSGDMTYNSDGSYSRRSGDMTYYNGSGPRFPYKKATTSAPSQSRPATGGSVATGRGTRARASQPAPIRIVKVVGTTAYYSDGSTITRKGDLIYSSATGIVYRAKCAKGAKSARDCKLTRIK